MWTTKQRKRHFRRQSYLLARQHFVANSHWLRVKTRSRLLEEFIFRCLTNCSSRHLRRGTDRGVQTDPHLRIGLLGILYTLPFGRQLCGIFNSCRLTWGNSHSRSCEWWKRMRREQRLSIHYESDHHDWTSPDWSKNRRTPTACILPAPVRTRQKGGTTSEEERREGAVQCGKDRKGKESFTGKKRWLFRNNSRTQLRGI